jgi:hypothetical protein
MLIVACAAHLRCCVQSSRYSNMLESISKLEKAFEVHICTSLLLCVCVLLHGYVVMLTCMTDDLLQVALLHHACSPVHPWCAVQPHVLHDDNSRLPNSPAPCHAVHCLLGLCRPRSSGAASQTGKSRHTLTQRSRPCRYVLDGGSSGSERRSIRRS